jgi:hypothetical protein
MFVFVASVKLTRDHRTHDHHIANSRDETFSHTVGFNLSLLLPYIKLTHSLTHQVGSGGEVPFGYELSAKERKK